MAVVTCPLCGQDHESRRFHVFCARVPARKRLVLVIGLLACLGWFTFPNYRINTANYNRIQNGMSRTVVYDILGGPPYTGCALELAIRYLNHPPPAAWEQWAVRDDYGIRVCFDENERVLDKIEFYRPGGTGGKTFLEKVHDWLHLPWW
jgi:hypothetical protein